MGELSRNLEIINKLHRLDLNALKNLSMLYDMAVAIEEDDIDRAIAEMKFVKSRTSALTRTEGQEAVDLYWKATLFLARNRDLRSYLLYLERYRDPADRFYIPRMKEFEALGLTQALQDLIDDKLDVLTISCPPGIGKAQDLNSKIFTPDGFIRMGDVKVGDEVLSGEGRTCRVIGVFPQGKMPLYELTFDDGSKCRCTEQHLWKTQTRDDRRKNKSRVVELSSMMKNLYVECGKRANYSIDYVKPVERRKKSLLLHPYLMGALLGDGGLSDNCVRISNPEVFILNKVQDILPSDDELSHIDRHDYRVKRKQRNNQKCDTHKAIIAYGLDGHHSYEKFIPDDYLYSDVSDRIELLHGLFDTDGYASGTCAEYTTTSERLRDGIIDLVHSLGGYVSYTEKDTHYTKDGERIKCRRAYRMVVQFAADTINPFSVPRKAENFHPFRREMKRFLKSVEYIGDEECQCIMVDDPCHLYITDNYIITHNTTLSELFLSGWIGWDPDACNLFSSHSGHVTRMVYDVISNIIGADLKKGQIPEYAWSEIFPDVQVQDVNAKEETINLGKFKAFKSITFRAIGASQTGVTRADGLLYCDDLCSGIEEALSKQRLDKLWQKYTTDLRTRKKGGRNGRKVKELHVCTRWSVWDVVGRLQKQYIGDERCRFLAFPDIDPETGKSNWNYQYGVGFDEKYFEDIESTLDPITYKCLFKNQPVEREGLLFEPDVLRRYDELPEGKYPDAIMAFLDPKGTGTDYNCLGVFFQYGEDYYLEDVVFRNIDPYILDDLNADCLVRNNTQICQVESNKEGVRTGDSIQEKVRARGGRCVIEKKFATTNKETRIIVSSPWIINHVLFKKPKSSDNPDGYMPNSEYGQFMSYLTSYSQLTKNTHDDAPDMVTMLAIHEGADGDSVTAVIHGSIM